MSFPYPHEIVHGSAAIARLHALRAIGTGTPVILGGAEQFEHVQEFYGFDESTVEELLMQASRVDPLAWLAKREQVDEVYYEMEPAEWPADASPSNALTAHLDIISQQPLDEVYITVLPTSDAWACACYLKIGGWNEVPNAHEHAALWRYWEDRYGAKVACIANDVIEFTVERPPQTRDEAMQLARQQYIYCADIVQQGTQSVEALAATILNARAWYFWWD